jgi:hypothetical protein
MQDAKASSALKYAILALSARQRELSQKRNLASQDAESTRFYSTTLRLTWASSQSQLQHVIYTYIILKFFDMISVEPRGWRRYAEEIMPFPGGLSSQAFNEELMGAMFWFFARMGKFCLFYPVLSYALRSQKGLIFFKKTTCSVLIQASQSRLFGQSVRLVEGLLGRGYSRAL